MTPDFNDIMSIAVKIVNYIKNNALHLKCFAALCDNFNTDHLQLLYHSEVRWLFKERVLNCLLELRRQIYVFLKDLRSPLAEHCIDDYFCAKLAYLF